jgi:predicted NUDIX family NTP pyrophosphohydrolase
MQEIPKRRLENGLDEKTSAAKKIEEEIGIPVTIDEKIGENEYIANKPEQGKVVKHVSYFLASAEYKPLTLERKENKGGLDDVRWFEEGSINTLRMYDDIRPLITQAVTKVKDRQKS